MDPEIKAALEEQMKTFTAFKAANDAMQGQITKLGAADVVTAEEVKKINGAMDAIADKIEALSKRTGDVEVKLNRPGNPADPDAKAELKTVEEFNQTVALRHQLKGRLAPPAITVEQYRDYRKMFFDYCRLGDAALNSWGDAERKAMSVGVDPDGGYLVPRDTSGRMIVKIYETSPIRQIASVQQISTDALTGPNDLGEVSGGWVSETGTRSESTTPNVGEWRIPVEEVYALPKASQKLLDDAAVDVEAWLIRKGGDKLGRLQNTAFVTGNGVGKPRGFASYTTAATADGSRAWGTPEHVATGTNGSFGTAPNGSDKLIDLVHKLKADLRQGARFVMPKVTVGAVRQLKANNEYIWLPSMDATKPSTLLGYPVTEAEDMAAYTTTDALGIAFGNFVEGYQIVDRTGMRLIRDHLTSKPWVLFYLWERVGGDVLNFDAIKFLKFGTS